MKKQVLIADADEQFCNELAAALKEDGSFAVMGVAKDGEEALQLAGEKRPDVIILDLLLPLCDGISVLDAVAAMHTGCKVFVVTGFVSSYIMSALASRQVSCLLRKPCAVSCLVDRLKEELLQDQLPIQEKLPNLHQQITAMLHDIGVPANIKGYHYLREAIKLTVEDFDRINNMTECIYIPIALAESTTPKRVQRAILHAIEIAWDRGNLDTLQRFFGYTVSNTKGRPTNSEFIALLADKILLTM